MPPNAQRAALRLARPSHWVKNVLVVLPIGFAVRWGDPRAWLHVLLAAAAFCLASSSVYVFNDLRDRHRDRLHPAKARRPLAAKDISPGAAAIESALLALAALALSAVVNPAVVAVLAAYLALQAAYSLYLKPKALVDVICIAMGFVLRAAAGALAIPVEISPWLFVCTFTLCLFLGFCKRCNELATLGAARPDDRTDHRPTLVAYTPELLTHLITVSAGLAVVAFLAYALSGRTVAHYGTDYLVYTLPLMVYGVFRFAMLSLAGRYADPTDLILHDRPFQFTVLLWLAAVALIIQFGRDAQHYMTWLVQSYQK